MKWNIRKTLITIINSYNTFYQFKNKFLYLFTYLLIYLFIYLFTYLLILIINDKYKMNKNNDINESWFIYNIYNIVIIDNIYWIIMNIFLIVYKLYNYNNIFLIINSNNKCKKYKLYLKIKIKQIIFKINYNH